MKQSLTIKDIVNLFVVKEVRSICPSQDGRSLRRAGLQLDFEIMMRNSQPGQPAKRRRSSRWEEMDIRKVEQQRLLSRLQTITNAINTNSLPLDELCRSPSPPPVYDNRGKRVNTRYDRALDKVEGERFKICARLKKLDPAFLPPRGMRPPKCIDKLFIPKEKEGTLNFIGLILGPRGNTQKRLEKDYDCKVAIRGKGSVKDGRARGPPQMEDHEPLHVVISAEGLDARFRIDECKKKIMDIITPRQDRDNDHKQAQLRELAQLNGTLREQDHEFRSGRGREPNSSSDVLCATCGDPSHPTADCPKRATDAELDADYQSFVAEVNGHASGTQSSTTKSASEIDGGAPGPGGVPPTAPWLRPGAFASRPPQPPPPGTVIPSAPQFGSVHVGPIYPEFTMPPPTAHDPTLPRSFPPQVLQPQGRIPAYSGAPYSDLVAPPPPQFSFAQFDAMGVPTLPPPPPSELPMPPPSDMDIPPPPPPPPDMHVPLVQSSDMGVPLPPPPPPPPLDETVPYTTVPPPPPPLDM